MGGGEGAAKCALACGGCGMRACESRLVCAARRACACAEAVDDPVKRDVVAAPRGASRGRGESGEPGAPLAWNSATGEPRSMERRARKRLCCCSVTV